MLHDSDNTPSISISSHTKKCQFRFYKDRPYNCVLLHMTKKDVSEIYCNIIQLLRLPTMAGPKTPIRKDQCQTMRPKSMW